MDKNNIINEYFEWMTNIVCGKRFSGKMTYTNGLYLKIRIFLKKNHYRIL